MMRAYRYRAATGRTLACSTVRTGRCSTRIRRWSCCRSRWRWPPRADGDDDGQRTSRALRRRRCRAVAVDGKTRATASLTEYCRRYCCWIRWPSRERWLWRRRRSAVPCRLRNKGEGKLSFKYSSLKIPGTATTGLDQRQIPISVYEHISYLHRTEIIMINE